jgi:ligand-binding sensor domain-containing protein
VYDLYLDENENLWVGTLNGICLKFPSREAFSRLKIDASDIENAEVLENFGYIEILVPDTRGILWGAGPGIPGLLKIDPNTISLSVIQKLGSLILPTVSEIHCDAAGYLWFGIDGNSLIRMNLTISIIPASGRMKVFLLPPCSPSSMIPMATSGSPQTTDCSAFITS